MTERIERFEDLIAWQKALKLASRIYEITGDGDFAKDYGLRNQIQRAAVSIMSNFADGFERSRPAEFAQFVSIAKASCAEVRSQLYLASDVGYITRDELAELMRDSREVGRILGGLRRGIEKRKSVS
ncbi:MAG: four helix bundle protein [Aridibacter famidurans]|nr:four helix bundle protein [Aridibacter famidurans]